jgi:hypothetical protein
MTRVIVIALVAGLAAPGAASLAQTTAATASKLAEGVWGYVDKGGKVVVSGSFLGVPPDSSLLPTALAARQAFDFRDDPVLGCGAPGMPRALTAGSPMTFAWVGGDLAIRYESMDVARTVRMGPQAPRPGSPRTPNGYSVGRWEGDTLVITTTLLDQRIVDLLGTPKSEDMSLEERYRVEESGDATYLRLDLTMTDPRTFVEPYVWHFDFVLRTDWELMDYECVERPAELTPGVLRN